MAAPRKITKIIVHCSATLPTMDIGVETIRKWHVNDNGWSDVGYHYVIRRNGAIEKGRPENVKGAHCAAKNGNVASLGICMVGGVKKVGGKLIAESNFTPEQWASLKKLVADIQKRYPIDTLLGHRDLDPGKACPSFSVREWGAKEKLLPLVWR